MHSSSQGGSMAATLIQRKSFVKSLNGGGGGPTGDGDTDSDTEQTAVTGGGGAPPPGGTPPNSVKTFLPVSKTLIHHLLPTAVQHQGDHHHHHHHHIHHHNHHPHNHSHHPGGQHQHRTVQYRTNRGTPSINGAFGSPTDTTQCLEELFESLPHQTDPEPRGSDTAGCVWDSMETGERSPPPPALAGTVVPPPGDERETTINHNQPVPDGGVSRPDIPSASPSVLPDGVDPASDPGRTLTEPNVEPDDGQDVEPEPEIDIVINNVVCSFSVRCHLNLHDIALNGDNVEFRRENGMVTMKLRRPYTTASIWSSGKITCTGATSEDQAKVAARRYSRCLQKLGFNVRLRNFRIVNVLGTCSMPWGIKIVNFSEKYKKDASYEPELHPGVTYKLYTPRATLKIFSTGSITVTAASVAFVQAAIEHIFPLVYEFRKKRNQHEKLELLKPPPSSAFDTHGDDYEMTGMPDDGEPPAPGDDPTTSAMLDDDDDGSETVEKSQRTQSTNGQTKAIDKSNSITAVYDVKQRSMR